MARRPEPETQQKALAVMTELYFQLTPFEPIDFSAQDIRAAQRRYPSAPSAREVTFDIAMERLPDSKEQIIEQLVADKLRIHADAPKETFLKAIRQQGRRAMGYAGAVTPSSYTRRILDEVLGPFDARERRRYPGRYTYSQIRAAEQLSSEWDNLRKAWEYWSKKWDAQGWRGEENYCDDRIESIIEHPVFELLSEEPEKCFCTRDLFPHYHCEQCDKVVEGIGGPAHIDRGDGRFESLGILCNACGPIANRRDRES